MKPINQNIAVLWDMDGVLVDTGNFHYLAWKQSLTELGIPFDDEIFRQTFGMNNAGIMERLLGKVPGIRELNIINTKKESLFRELAAGNLSLLPGILDWLNQFQQWGFKQAITSSAPPENIDLIVETLRIHDYFDVIVTGSDIPGKPNPDIFLKAAKEVLVRPENCVVIEDAIAGVNGAKNAGMKCIAVTTTNPSDALKNADYIVDHLGMMSQDDFLALLD